MSSSRVGCSCAGSSALCVVSLYFGNGCVYALLQQQAGHSCTILQGLSMYDCTAAAAAAAVLLLQLLLW
jgi:hypothetical protein